MRVKPSIAGAPAETSGRAGRSSRPGRAARPALDGIRRVYAARSARGKDPRYSAYAMPALLALYQRERMLLTKLGATCEKDLHELEILDVGCGSGGDLV